jgi:hypothetical protein
VRDLAWSIVNVGGDEGWTGVAVLRGLDVNACMVSVLLVMGYRARLIR